MLFKYPHSPSLSLNEWIFIGVSIYRTNRVEEFHDIHIVSRTISGVENHDSFLSQNIDNYWSLLPNSFPSMYDGLKFITVSFGEGKEVRFSKICNENYLTLTILPFLY